MSDRSERLFAALSELSDRHIEEAATAPVRKKTQWKQWGTAAACLTLVAVTASVFPHLGGCGASGGSAPESAEPQENATEFMSYAGPILPLTLNETNDAITAERDVTLDFAPWVPQWVTNEEMADAEPGRTPAQRAEILEQYQEWYPEGGRWNFTSDLLVRDSYALTNTSDQEQTVTVQLPFLSSLHGLAEEQPTLTLNGEDLPVRLLAGRDPDGLQRLSRWEECQAYLEDGSVRRDAMENANPGREQPVTVYAFTDDWAGETDPETQPNPSVQAAFTMDYDRTQVLTYGFNGGSNNRETGHTIREFSIHDGHGRRPEAELLLVLGEDLTDLDVTYHVTGGSDPETPTLDNAGVTVTRHESTLGLVLDWVLQDWQRQRRTPELLDTDTRYRLLTQWWQDDWAEINRRGGMLEDALDQVEGSSRAFWAEAVITIPAGETVELEATSRKPPSFDFYGEGGSDSLRGYDLMPWLDTNLTFTAQTATLVTQDQVEVVNQNFGFDPAEGILTVPLDPNEPHYYLEVTQKST